MQCRHTQRKTILMFKICTLNTHTHYHKYKNKASIFSQTPPTSTNNHDLEYEELGQSSSGIWETVNAKMNESDHPIVNAVQVSKVSINANTRVRSRNAPSEIKIQGHLLYRQEYICNAIPCTARSCSSVVQRALNFNVT